MNVVEKDNDQQDFINTTQLNLEKLLYSKKLYVPYNNLRNWNISVSAIIDNAVFEITNTVLAEKKDDQIIVDFSYKRYKGLFDHFVDIISKFKFLNCLSKFVNYDFVDVKKVVELKQYILYPSLDKTYHISKYDYNIRDVV